MILIKKYVITSLINPKFEQKEYKMEEKRLDLRIKSEDREKEIQRTNETLFKLNHTLPFSDEYNMLLKELFIGGMGRDCYILTPMYVNIAKNIHIGNNVSINAYTLNVCQPAMFI